MTLAGQLDESEEGAGELGVVHVFLPGSTVGADSQTLGLRVPLEGVEVEDAAAAHETGYGGEETHVLLLLEVVQHPTLDVDVAAPEYGYAELERLHDHLAGYALARRDVEQNHLRDTAVGQAGLVEEQLLLLYFLFLKLD